MAFGSDLPHGLGCARSITILLVIELRVVFSFDDGVLVNHLSYTNISLPYSAERSFQNL